MHWNDQGLNEGRMALMEV